jgi:GNAT superfamily N-acetyltransferase
MRLGYVSRDRSIIHKFNTFLTLFQNRQFRVASGIVAAYFVRIEKYRMDLLDVASYMSRRFLAKMPIKCKMACEADMRKLFHEWRDSREEYDRHHEVYYKWGFKRCLLTCNSDTEEVVNFQFLLTTEDLANVRKYLPWSTYKDLTSKACAHHNWTYTFERHRRLGIQTQAVDFAVEFCRENGIKWLHSQRGFTNEASIRYADRVGFLPMATIYHVQFLWQQKHSGLYIVKKMRLPNQLSL